MSAPNILVVDDEPLIALMVADQPSELGYQVEGPAHNLEDAKRLATNAAIDAALIDVNLGNGVRSSPIAEILVERKIPFTFVTGYHEVADERFHHARFYRSPFSLRACARQSRKCWRRGPA
jgi:chemotaxis family two-component system sensor kinase Cph1